jgi:hypothetical protein
MGHVFVSEGQAEWMAAYASYPTPLVLKNGTVRIFFSPRDSRNRSSIASLDLQLSEDRFDILALSGAPLLSPGPRGSFDDSGVTVSCVVPVADSVLVYYLGWNLSVTVPFRNSIGLAIGTAEATILQRVSPAPIVDRCAIDPYSLGYAWVLRGGEDWRMWYGSHLQWGPEGLDMLHVIKEATSNDGFLWHREGRVSIPLAGSPEFATSRPCVIRDGDQYRMWYCRKDPEYRMGYAEMFGDQWIRLDDTLSFTGAMGDWESKTIEYPAIFDHGGRRYMLYNGNGHGRTGFGIAVLEI